mgnify:CR=1 FL=1
MKMNNVQRQYESTVTGPKIKMGFAADAASHLAELMSNSVYQDKFGSIVREVVSNAVDANAEVSSTQRVQVTLVNKRSLSHAVGEFRVRDFGLGISPDRIENIFTQYFASTKRDTNDQIGGFGIGAKSPFAYSPVFQVITHIDGVRRQYLLEKSSSDRTCSLINTGETTEDNGTEIVIPVTDHEGIYNFVSAMENQLMLMSHQLDITVPDDYQYAESTIYDYGKFLRIVRADRTLEHNGHIVSLGNVLYKIPPITGDSYEMSNYIIKMNIGDVNPTLSREGLELNDSARDLILSKMDSIEAQFDQWCIDQSQSTVDLQHLLSRDSSKLKYPDSRDVVRCRIDPEIKRIPTGWPSQMSVDLLPRILSQVITPSTRYSSSKRKWRSASHFSMKKIIVGDPHDDRGALALVRKKVDDRIGTVWKEFLADRFQDSDKDVLVFNVDSNLDEPIASTCKYSCRDYDEDQKAQIYSEIKASVIACLNQFFENHTEKFSDYEPTKQWLAQRKERMKQNRKNQSKWTPEMLATRIPLKNVCDNAFQRTELTYSQLKNSHAIVLEYRQAKLVSWNNKSQVPIYAVSSQNFKRCQKAGINCWDEAKFKQLVQRWHTISEEKLRSKSFHTGPREGNIANSIVMRRCHMLIPMPSREVENRSASPIQFVYTHKNFGINFKEHCETSILQLDGAVYSHIKIEAQLRNLQKYSEDKPQLRIAINSLFQEYITDDLYRQAFNSLK